MNYLSFVLVFVAGVATTIVLEIMGLHALLEPLRQPIEALLSLRA